MRLKQKIVLWIEGYLFYPTPLGQLISALLLPLTLIYCLIKFVQKSLAKTRYYGIKVVSIGNLLVGGTGKTPFTITLANKFPNSAVVLRGYKRQSKGLYIISKMGTILQNVQISGDEAYEYALSCPQSIVIVSEDRVKGILKAKELGASIVFLDDGYSKRDILKLDILLRPKDEPTNLFCLPSGGYKEPKIEYLNAHIVAREDEDFVRKTSYSFYDTNSKIFTKVDNLPADVVFVTGISKPTRVLEFLPQGINCEFFEDHYNFLPSDIENICKKYNTTNIIVTKKDFVKLIGFERSFFIINLDVTITNSKILDEVEQYKNLN